MQTVTRAEAKAQGLTRYFTGKPCKHGHVAERLTSCNICVVCNRVRVGRAQKHNRDRATNNNRVYREKNKDNFDFKLKACARAKASYDRNVEASREMKRAQYRSRAVTHPSFYIEHNNRRRARMLSAPGDGITAADIEALKREQNYFCAYCFELRPLALDHVAPVSRGGAHDVSNAVMACKSCNSRKSNRPLLIFLMDMGVRAETARAA